MVSSYLRDLIAELTDPTRPEADEDGDNPVDCQNCQSFARIIRADEEVLVRLFSVIAKGVDLTPELAVDFNRIDGQLALCRMFHVDGQILVEADPPADTLSMQTFANRLDRVIAATNYFGPDLLEQFGAEAGFTPVPPEETLPGHYL